MERFFSFYFIILFLHTAYKRNRFIPFRFTLMQPILFSRSILELQEKSSDQKGKKRIPSEPEQTNESLVMTHQVSREL